MTDDYHDRKTYLERYSEHSARLQNWIGAYGAGLATMLAYQFRTAISDARDLARTATRNSDPPVFVIQDHISWMHYALAWSFKLIALALAAQILLLFLNKSSQFAIAHASEDAKEWSPFERVSEWFSRKFVFDAACDLASVSLLGAATYYGIAALGLMA
jgi:hypothetical protein